MPFWKVNFSHKMDIVADNEKEAGHKAREMWNKSIHNSPQMKIEVSGPTEYLPPLSYGDDYDDKTITILGHTIKYWYAEDFDGTMNDCDVEYIEKLIKEEYREGEIYTSDPDPENDEDYHGWWKISEEN